jgi:hypothetical protein
VPFEGKNPSEVMHKHLKAPPGAAGPRQPQAERGRAISEVIEMMMAKMLSCSSRA